MAKAFKYSTIDARAAWLGDREECARLYRQFVERFEGNFNAIRRYYGWKRSAMVLALRAGQ